MHVEHDITLIGWGPVGKALAIWLLDKGHRVAVVERWPQNFPLPRAVAFDHEIGRLLQSLGIGAELERLSAVPGSYEWRNAAGDVLQRFDWVGMGLSGWPAMSTFCQPELEGVLEARAARSDRLTLHRGLEVVACEQGPDGVDVRAVPHAGADADAAPLRIFSRYVVGCDGANSFVRNAMGARLLDRGFEADWLVVDAMPTDPARWTPDVSQLCDPQRPTTVVSSGPGRRRWEFMLLPGETKAAMNDPAVAWRLLEPWDYSPANARLERHAVYTFRGAAADTWRAGRLMIAGDAAHQMPPFAAQGLCSGLRDAASLAWRLDLVLRGLCDEQLLDSYGSERLPHVEQIIDFAIALGHIICVTDAAAAAARDAQMLAARDAPHLAPPPPPLPRLGAGVRLADDPQAGYLGLQARVSAGGREARFDDLIGRGFVLLSATGDPSQALSKDNREFWARLEGVAVHVGGDAVADSEGAYARWLASIGAAVVLMRPDFNIFGTAPDLAGAQALVAALRQALSPIAIAAASPAEVAHG